MRTSWPTYSIRLMSLINRWHKNVRNWFCDGFSLHAFHFMTYHIILFPLCARTLPFFWKLVEWFIWHLYLLNIFILLHRCTYKEQTFVDNSVLWTSMLCVPLIFFPILIWTSDNCPILLYAWRCIFDLSGDRLWMMLQNNDNRIEDI